jgi:hypothetical protein
VRVAVRDSTDEGGRRPWLTRTLAASGNESSSNHGIDRGHAMGSHCARHSAPLGARTDLEADHVTLVLTGRNRQQPSRDVSRGSTSGPGTPLNLGPRRSVCGIYCTSTECRSDLGPDMSTNPAPWDHASNESGPPCLPHGVAGAAPLEERILCTGLWISLCIVIPWNADAYPKP